MDNEGIINSLLNNAELGIIHTDLEGKITYVNETFAKITGYSKEEIIGNNPNILKSGKHPEDFYKELWDKIKNREVYNTVICNKKKNGTFYWQSLTITPLMDDTAELTGFLGVIFDVTQEVEAEKELQLFIEHMKEDTLLIFDKDFICCKVFPKKDLKESSVDKFLNCPVEAIFRDEDSKELIDIFHKINADATTSYTFYTTLNIENTLQTYEFIVSRFNTQKFALWGRNITNKLKFRVLADFRTNVDLFTESTNRIIGYLGLTNGTKLQ